MFALYDETTVHGDGTESCYIWHMEGKNENEIDEKMEKYMDTMYGVDNVVEGEGVEKVYDLDSYSVAIELNNFFDTKELLAEAILSRTKAGY
jgi:hypothetical protein